MNFLHFVWNYSAPFLAIGGGLWAFLSALWASHAKARLDKDFARHKAELDSLAFVHQTQFSILHADRVRAIKELHAQLRKTQEILREMKSPVPKKEPPDAYKDISALDKIFKDNCFYFPESFAYPMDLLLISLHRCSNAVSRYWKAGRDTPELKQAISELIENDQELNNNVAALEKLLRKLLGVSESL